MTDNKRCFKCGETKLRSEFHKNKRRSDGVQSYCKACAKIRNAAYYLATPERNPQRQESRVKARRVAYEYVQSHLSKHPCVDCEETDTIVLEFDHVRGTKSYNISNMVWRGFAVGLVQEEIDKCDVRCANCHRRVTSSRGNWYANYQ